MHRRMKILVFTRDEALEMLNASEKSIVTTVIPALNDLIKQTKGKSDLASSVTFSSLKEKDDSKIFQRLLKVVEKYLKIFPQLRQKFEEELPDTISGNTNNMNVRIALSLLSEGIFFAENLPGVLSYIINKYYSKSGTELDPNITREIGHRVILLSNIIPELEKADLGKVVDVIGNIPTIRSLRYEETSEIPTDVVMGFFKDNFKISDFYTSTLIKRFLGYFEFKKEHKKHNDIAKRFIGNPIYHIRLFLIDIDLLKLERLKEKKRLLELRLLELQGKNDPKIKKQIEYYEDKLNKLELKIEKLTHMD